MCYIDENGWKWKINLSYETSYGVEKYNMVAFEIQRTVPGIISSIFSIFIIETVYYILYIFTFTFSHFADAFIQSDLQLGNA